MSSSSLSPQMASSMGSASKGTGVASSSVLLDSGPSKSAHTKGSGSMVHAEVSKPQEASQARVPPSKPSVRQVSEPRSEPSQASEDWLMAPSPQMGSVVQAEVSKPQVPEQARVPPSKPCVRQVSEPRSEPSQASEDWLMAASPQMGSVVQAEVSKPQVPEQARVPPSKPCVRQVS